MRILFQCHYFHLRPPESDTHTLTQMVHLCSFAAPFFYCLSQSLRLVLGVLTASFRNQSRQELKLQHLSELLESRYHGVSGVSRDTFLSVREFHWNFYCVLKSATHMSPNCLFGVIRERELSTKTSQIAHMNTSHHSNGQQELVRQTRKHTNQNIHKGFFFLILILLCLFYSFSSFTFYSNSFIPNNSIQLSLSQ